MATTGLVQHVLWAQPVVCVWIGQTPTSAEAFFVIFRNTDTEMMQAFKRSIIKLLGTARAAGYQVTVERTNSGGEIDSVTLETFDISPIGLAVHNDFYSVAGRAIPTDVQVVFDSPTVTVSVVPDFVRPHWVLISSLPSSIPVGANRLRLVGAGFASDWVPIDVRSGPRMSVRALYTGAPKDSPYNIVFAANPAIRTETGALITDPVLSNRPMFQSVVAYCLRNLLTSSEDFLRQGDWDASIRFVTIFDPTLSVTDANALVQEDSPNIMETRRDKLNAFASPYGEEADIVFCMHGSTTHNRASAWFTSDDAARASTAYAYDGIARVHGHFRAIPGSAALPLDMVQSGLTPLHEYGHAGSDFVNGMVHDLYVDGSPGGFMVNKKWRATAVAPVPVNFATYEGTTRLSDQTRDGLGYGVGWTSYHCELIDSAHPNLMDNYWLAAGGNPQVCRLDRLTYAWYSDRLRAKLTR